MYTHIHTHTHTHTHTLTCTYTCSPLQVSGWIHISRTPSRPWWNWSSTLSSPVAVRLSSLWTCSELRHQTSYVHSLKILPRWGVLLNIISYRIAGNFHWCKISRSWHPGLRMKFAWSKFRGSQSIHKNHEILHHAKISCYTVHLRIVVGERLTIYNVYTHTTKDLSASKF